MPRLVVERDHGDLPDHWAERRLGLSVRIELLCPECERKADAL